MHRAYPKAHGRPHSQRFGERCRHLERSRRRAGAAAPPHVSFAPLPAQVQHERGGVAPSMHERARQADETGLGRHDRQIELAVGVHFGERSAGDEFACEDQTDRQHCEITGLVIGLDNYLPRGCPLCPPSSHFSDFTSDRARIRRASRCAGHPQHPEPACWYTLPRVCRTRYRSSSTINGPCALLYSTTDADSSFWRAWRRSLCWPSPPLQSTRCRR